MKLPVMVFFLALLLTACSPPVTESEALQIARDRFSKVCAGSRYDPNAFVGPIRTTVGGVAFAYEWKERAVGSDFGILITIDETGYINVSSFGTLPELRSRQVKK